MKNKSELIKNETITIAITKEDKDLYDYLKCCKNEQSAKNLLYNVLNTYLWLCGDQEGIHEGFLTPENMKERKFKKFSDERLLQLKKEYEKDILLEVSDFHPDEFDCGIFRGPDTEWWFIDEYCNLGHITLYANYIKMINAVLDERKKGVH